jgi:hypothetical protein
MSKKLIVELDMTHMRTHIGEDDIKEIIIVYYDLGEDAYWSESVPFKILKADYKSDKEAGKNE